MIKIVLELLEC